MPIQLISDRDQVLNQLTEFDAVDYWASPTTKEFRIKFGFIQQSHQIQPFLSSKNPLIKPNKEQIESEAYGEWHSYYQPSVSVAKRASTTPALDPSYSNQSVEIALLCSVVVPSAKLMTPRQLRWLDLFGLSLVVLNSDSNVVHLFRSEYVFLRRLNVFTSAHPVKAISFPVRTTSPLTQSLMEQYNEQIILLPYFNKNVMENMTADFMSCMTINGFKQNDMKDNPWYQAFATTYTGMIKRYERCHQLKGIVLALMVANPAYAKNPHSINPFNIRYKYNHQEIPSKISDKDRAKLENKVKYNHLLTTMGAVGIYEVLLEKKPIFNRDDPIFFSLTSEDKRPVGMLNFFLSSLNSGIMPFGDIDTFLSQIFSKHLHNETYKQLLYNSSNHLGFLNDVNKDDVLLALYLKISNDDLFATKHPHVLSALSTTNEPLDLIRNNF